MEPLKTVSEDIVTVFITASTLEEGRKVASALLNSHLAACVNLVPGIESHYWWEGKLEQAEEVLLIAKTRRALVGPLVDTVKKNHSYTVPEAIALTVVGGNADYLEWVRDETHRRRADEATAGAK